MLILNVDDTGEARKINFTEWMNKAIPFRKSTRLSISQSDQKISSCEFEKKPRKGKEKHKERKIVSNPKIENLKI